MEKRASQIFLVSLLIVFASVVEQSRANTCSEGLGTCENCDQRCKDKHGPASQSNCDRTVGVALCTCYYPCGSPTPRRRTCSGGAGLCSLQTCPEKCCEANCARKYNGGQGSCNNLGNFSFCQCEYPC